MSTVVQHQNAGVAWSQVPETTIIELVRDACQRDPDRPLLIFEDGLTVTRRDLVTRVETFAAAVRNRIAPGDRVAIILDNRAEFMTAWLTVVALRATLVSVNPDVKEHDARHVLRDSDAVLAIISPKHQALIETVRGDCPQLRDVVVVGDNEPDGLPAPETGTFSLDEAGCERGDITNVYYTSGTTGPPKGCMVDHEWWLRIVDVDLRLHPKGPDDRMLCCLQFYYADPGWQVLAALRCGGAVVVMRRFSVSRFWNVVRSNDVTEVLGIASIPALLLKAEPSDADRGHKVKRALQVAVPANLHREMTDRWGFPWVDGYGITEGNFVTRVPLDLAEEMVGSGSIGIACPEVSIRLVDDDGADVSVGATGEFWISGPGLMRGYLNRPEATAEVLQDGWFHTGDLGRQDERGLYYFVGRKKDIIRRSGENLAAAEVEEVLRAHPKVLEVAVIGVPDDLRGEEVKAFILPVEGHSAATIPPEELAAWCAARLAAYKVPRYIEYRSTDFPRTPSLRVQKTLLGTPEHDRQALVWDRENPHVSASEPAT
ncbi:MAG TPA: acyl-CoA synthetase [Actinobacteria bacterium]|nr:acyl-CoA synthetase [Actinomycetota bacterium]